MGFRGAFGVLGVWVGATFALACGESSMVVDAGPVLDSAETPLVPDTTRETIREIQESETRLSDQLCGCEPSLTAIADMAGAPFDRSTCEATLAAPREQWACLTDNFGAESPDAVPGLACSWTNLQTFETCLAPISCGAEQAGQAASCFFAWAEELDRCNLGSVDAEDPPELIECF